MNLMDSQDLSCVDFDELGIRPSNYIDECNDTDLNETADGHLAPGKLHDVQLMSNGKQFMLDDADALMVEEDDSDYEIDPETGQYRVYFSRAKKEKTRQQLSILALLT
jgi:hypothetical protein